MVGKSGLWQRNFRGERNFLNDDPTLSSRPERSGVEGPAVSFGRYNHPLLRAKRAASMRFAAPSLLIASDK